MAAPAATGGAARRRRTEGSSSGEARAAAVRALAARCATEQQRLRLQLWLKWGAALRRRRALVQWLGRWPPFAVQLAVCFAVAWWLAQWEPPAPGATAAASRRLAMLWGRLFLLAGTVITCSFITSLFTMAPEGKYAGHLVRAADQAKGELSGNISGSLPSAYNVHRREGEVVLRYSMAAVRPSAEDLDCDTMEAGVDPHVWRWVWGVLARPSPDVYHRMHSWGRKHLCGRLLSVYAFDAVASPQQYYLLSPPQWAALLSPLLAAGAETPAAAGGAPPRCLDIGAGRCIVQGYRALFPGGVVATEPTFCGARALRRQGVTAVRTALPTARSVGSGFAAVMLLNVLDRAARPRTLLQAALKLVRPGGLVVIALVLPVMQYACKERLSIPGGGFDDSFVSLLHWLRQHGLQPRRALRCPYLCSGPPAEPLYALDAAVVACSVA